MLRSMKKLFKRTVAMLLCAMLLLGAVPLDLIPRASAAWYDPYMSQLKESGVMMDGRPNSTITRAEMAAVLNRAFGFRKTGPIPFTDVPRQAWYYNDIVVSYNEGIMTGTSRTTASPRDPITREQALALIGRCLRYEETAGEVTDFTDGQSFSNWSSIYARSALLAGVINGTGDGSFKPKRTSTRAEIAKMLSVAMGELVSSPGVTELGGVFGNVTVNSPNVTLRNTTIAGDLYLTGGVGLGNVILDNVRVLGRIIVAGGGEGESGEASVLLNNVTAHKLLVDPATGQYVSLRALGNTDIPETVVKSNAYIQDDVRNNSMGLRKVVFEEPAEGRFTIAGNMKDVTNKAPDSHLIVGDTGTGAVTKITVDEEATNSFVDLEINASVDDIKLDTSATITGSGSIGNIDVGANGCVSEILPDTVTVRPGVVTEIAGMTGIDSEKAKELSEAPRLLEGYPKAKNVAPTSAEVYFSTNKSGTLYWALTDAARGPLTDADVETLVSQPAYGSGFRQAGSMDITSSKTEFQLPLEELTQGGRYYVSATLVDAHGRRSHVKSRRIETPDGSVPAMANNGYPSITDGTPTRNEENAGLDFSEIANLQATVMANKSCDLYYVVLAAGSTAPSTNELLTAAFPDPYGYGRLHLIKNTLDSFKITEIDLDLDGTPEGLGEVKESTSYDLYYWLTDADGEQSSAVEKVTVTTKDVTPPEFTMGEMFQSDTKANSVTLSNMVNENSTVYWVVVEEGSDYPKKTGAEMRPQTPEWEKFLKDDIAKLQVSSGAYALKSGKLTANANTQFNISVTGLERETAYDVYYLAEDAAHNMTDVKYYKARTLDETPPTASLGFEDYPAESPETPYAYSTINVVFSEDICYRRPSGSTVNYEKTGIMDLYKDYRDAGPGSEAETLFTGALRDMIVLCHPNGQAVLERTATTAEGADWVVDYRNVEVYQDGKNLVVSFVNTPEKSETSALNLESGATYYFHLQNITDASQQRNQMGATDMDSFTTVSARVSIAKLDDLELHAYSIKDGEISDEPIYVYNDVITKVESTKTDKISADIAFTASPHSTSTSADGVKWDMIFWFDRSVNFMLFTKVHGTGDKWVPVGTDANGDPFIFKINVPANAKNYTGTSVIYDVTTGGIYSNSPQFQDINSDPALNIFSGGLNDSNNSSYDFALYFTNVDGRTDRASFDQLVNGQVTFVTGGAASLRDFTPASVDKYDSLRQGNELITDITWPNKESDLTDPHTRLLTKQFQDGREPVMISSYPRITASASGAEAKFALSAPGTIYYVLAPKTAGDNFVVNPQMYESNGTVNLVPYRDIETMVPMCNSQGPIGHAYTMASDLSIMERMFPNDFLDENGNPLDRMSGYKFDSPISTNVTRVEFSDVASEQLVSGSVEATRSERTFTIPGLIPDTEYLMYIVTTTGNSNVYSPVTVYRFKTAEMVKPIITTQATGAKATINTDQPGTNLVYQLIPYDSTMPPVFLEQFDKTEYVNQAFNSYRSQLSSKYVNGTRVTYGSENFTVLDAMLETVTVNSKQQSLFDICADPTLKERIANLIDGTALSEGGVTLGKVENSTNDSITFKCDEVWDGMHENTAYCLIAYGYCGTKPYNMSEKSFSAKQPIEKGQGIITVQVTNGLNYNPPPDGSGTNVGTIDGVLTLTFSRPLHFYTTSGSPNGHVALYNVPSTYNGPGGSPTKTSQSIESYLKPFGNAAGHITYLDSDNNNWGERLYQVNLGFQGLDTTSCTITMTGSYSGGSAPSRTGFTITVRVVNQQVNVSISDPTWLTPGTTINNP